VAGTIQMAEGGKVESAVQEASVGGSDWNASHLPSGDQAGRAPNLVSWRAGPPSAGTSHSPPRPREWKAILVPSGDQAGCVS
jgi:hypothetical protein